MYTKKEKSSHIVGTHILFLCRPKMITSTYEQNAQCCIMIKSEWMILLKCLNIILFFKGLCSILLLLGQ